jgi:hypothetical protein
LAQRVLPASLCSFRADCQTIALRLSEEPDVHDVAFRQSPGIAFRSEEGSGVGSQSTTTRDRSLRGERTPQLLAPHNFLLDRLKLRKIFLALKLKPLQLRLFGSGCSGISLSNSTEDATGNRDSCARNR